MFIHILYNKQKRHSFQFRKNATVDKRYSIKVEKLGTVKKLEVEGVFWTSSAKNTFGKITVLNYVDDVSVEKKIRLKF